MANELMYRAFNDMYGLPYVAMRYFNVYGPRMDTEGKYTEVLIRWYGLIKKGQPPLIFGDGDQTMDFVYVEDVARANVLAMKAPVSDEVFNVASHRETSLRQLCDALLETMGSKLAAHARPAAGRAQGGRGPASAGRHRQGPRTCWASRPGSASRRDSPASSLARRVRAIRSGRPDARGRGR